MTFVEVTSRRDFLGLDNIFARSRKERRQAEKQARQQVAFSGQPQPPDWNPFNHPISRRAFIIGGVTAGGIAAGAILARSKEWLFQLGQPKENPLPEGLLSVELIQQELQKLNKRLLQEPNKIAEIVPQLGNLAIRYFCQEMNSTLGLNTYQASNYTNRLFFEPMDEYTKKRAEGSGCTKTSDYQDEFGYVNVASNAMHFNTTIMLYEDFQRKIPNPLPAYLMFATILHEAHHATTPSLDIYHSSMNFRT